MSIRKKKERKKERKHTLRCHNLIKRTDERIDLVQDERRFLAEGKRGGYVCKEFEDGDEDERGSRVRKGNLGVGGGLNQIQFFFFYKNIQESVCVFVYVSAFTIEKFPSVLIPKTL